MGVEAKFQAIPEDCELLKHAREDREIAEMMQFFDMFAKDEGHPETPLETYFDQSVKELIQLHPGLDKRYFYAGSRTYDAIVYLLSPQRRQEETFESDQSHIKKAIWGSEHLHPEAHATQGIPIGFVPTKEVKVIADFLDSVTYELLHEHYHPAKMRVYKMRPDDGESRFQVIWAEFEGMRNVYREATAHNEAMITVID